MNEKKIQQLFVAARNEPAPAATPDFAADVLRTVRCEPRLGPANPVSIWEHLNGLFPRVAVAAALVIALCVAADWGLTVAGLPGVNDGAAQVTSQYLFNTEDL